MTNVIKLSGTVMATPELRQTKTNKSYLTFRIKVERENSTFKDYINCVCWDNDLAQKLARELNIDDEIGVVGSMQSNRYKNNQGATCYTYEVVVTDAKMLQKAPVKVQAQTQAPAYATAQASQTQAYSQPAAPSTQPAGPVYPKTDGFGNPMPNSSNGNVNNDDLPF